jgi:hypothetical protein
MSHTECKCQVITVRLWGGVVVCVEDIPPGIAVSVRDYDTVATGESIYPDDELLEDDFGGKCYETVWG